MLVDVSFKKMCLSGHYYFKIHRISNNIWYKNYQHRVKKKNYGDYRFVKTFSGFGLQVI